MQHTTVNLIKLGDIVCCINHGIIKDMAISNMFLRKICMKYCLLGNPIV